MIIGLTGGSGSGKSEAANFFVEKGFALVDADEECRKVTEKGQPALEKLSAAFGVDILDSEGNMDRKLVADIVFADKEKLEMLGSIVQGEALKSILGLFEEYKAQGKNIVFDVPLLFECGWDMYCDLTVCVSSYLEQRILRIVRRDGISVDQALARINNQMKDEERERLSDYVIHNNSDLDELRQNVYDILAKYNI